MNLVVDASVVVATLLDSGPYGYRAGECAAHLAGQRNLTAEVSW